MHEVESLFEEELARLDTLVQLYDQDPHPAAQAIIRLIGHHLRPRLAVTDTLTHGVSGDCTLWAYDEGVWEGHFECTLCADIRVANETSWLITSLLNTPPSMGRG